MKEYTVHVFFDREHRAFAAVTLDGRRHKPVELDQHDLDVVADIATRSACAEALGKEEAS